MVAGCHRLGTCSLRQVAHRLLDAAFALPLQGASKNLTVLTTARHWPFRMTVFPRTRKLALNKTRLAQCVTEAGSIDTAPYCHGALSQHVSSHNTPRCCSPPRPPRSPPSSPGTVPTSHSDPCARCARHNAHSMGVARALWRAPSAGSPARGTCERPAQTRSRPLQPPPLPTPPHPPPTSLPSPL